jgi:hypothetical protein
MKRHLLDHVFMIRILKDMGMIYCNIRERERGRRARKS